MSIRIDNNTFELKITPNKRKRDSAKDIQQSHHNKENNFVFNNFMEVKSIADLVKQKTTPSSMSTTGEHSNPFELARKPPKKKSKRDTDEGCFENPALNLNGPEKIFNPFEVKRMPNIEQENHCFTNPGLNIRGAERDVVNPYEVVRGIQPPLQPAIVAEIQGKNQFKNSFRATDFISFHCIAGIENPALDLQPALAIAVPFTPTVGCRIDFNNIPLDALTPCSMLNNKLVFSPIKKPTDLTPKRPNLSIISEEAVDISKELECYQLELENSMNEAKATKKRGHKNLMDMRRKSTFARRLMDAVSVNADDSVHQSGETDESKVIADDEQTASKHNNEHSCQESSDGHSECPKSSTPKTPNENCIAKYPLDKSAGEHPDFVYEEIDATHYCRDENVENDEIVGNVSAATDANDGTYTVTSEAPNPVQKDEFKNPAPFVRTYRRDLRRPTANAPPSGDDAASQVPIAGDKPKEHHHHEMFGSIRSSIRKSIRKLIHSGGGGGVSSTKSKSTENVSSKEGATTPVSSSSSNILASIRHSMRRKQPIKQPLATSTPCESLNDISIIDNCKPRAVFRDAASAATEKVVAMDAADKDAVGGGIFKGRTTIRSSFRKSSRHVMKSVFKKNIEDYNLEK